MSGKKQHWIAPSATPWDDIDSNALSPSEAIVKANHQSMYWYRHSPLSSETEAEFFNGYTRSACPRCGSNIIEGHGRDANDVHRWVCLTCKRSFTPMTGTIFEGHKLPVSDWVEFLLQAFSFESMNSMTRENRRSSTTVPFWMAKLFAILEGIQDTTILADEVQIDEKYYSRSASECILKPDGTKPRGFSRNHICIAIGCDSSGHSLFVHEGFGKPSDARAWAAYGAHIAPGSLLVHDMERTHHVLVDRLDLKSDSHNSKSLKGIPDSENPLRYVNRLCFLIELFLNSHSGFDRSNIQGYLDLFSVMMNPPENKMKKAAMVLDRAMRYPKQLSYRGFYGSSPSSGLY